MTNKRFQIVGIMVVDTMGVIPSTLWQDDKQKQKYCDELNNLHDENQAFKDIIEALQSELAHCEEGYILEEYL